MSVIEFQLPHEIIKWCLSKDDVEELKDLLQIAKEECKYELSVTEETGEDELDWFYRLSDCFRLLDSLDESEWEHTVPQEERKILGIDKDA